MKKRVFYWLFFGLIVVVGCQKELSFELGNAPSEGSLQSDVTGDCLPKTVTGSYIAGTPLVSTSSSITVSVNVTKTGTYLITTDTVNGYYFRGTGTFTTLGPTNVTLQSHGTPFASGINNFVVSYGSSVCDIQVTVLPAGTGPASFTLTGSGTPASCTTPVIAGTYGVGSPLNSGNTVTLNVNVTTAGSYTVTTTAVNGMTFSGTGTLATGPQTIVLTGTGTPATAGTSTIPVTAGSSTCSFTIPVSGPAVFTLAGSPSCTTPTIAGTYSVGVALTSTNKVTLNVNVTTAGAYNVTTAPAVNGMTFSGSGVFPGTGPQTIVLTGSGTPTTAGNSTIPVTAGSSTCSFVIPVGAGASFTVDCSSAFDNGTYQVGVPLGASNTVDIDVNVTALGPYTITTSLNGMTFSKAGTFSTLGTNSIVLQGTGTPVAAGTFNMPVNSGSTPCTFPIIVDPAPTIDWKYTINLPPSTTYQGSTDDAQLIPLGPVLTFVYFGSSTNEDISIALVDISGTINAGETYSTSATATNAASFQSTTATDDFTADNSTSGVSLVFTVTSHNTATKTITGTFAGTVKNSAGVTKTVTGGTFTGTYP